MGARLSGAGGQGGATISQNVDINVTPFVDIMLVLLIIFMVSAPLATVSLNLDIPAPNPEQSLPLKEPIYVNVQNGGGLYIGDRATTLAALPSDLCAVIGGDHCTEERIFIRAGADVSYDRFMAVMNDLQAHGFHQVGLLNEDIA